MQIEMTKGQLISAFKEACAQSGDLGALFIDDFIFNKNKKEHETLNEEVDRKFAALSEFASEVLLTYRHGGTFQNVRPRDTMDRLINIDAPETKQLRTNIYGAFYQAGHHIRALTDKPEYILPQSAIQINQMSV